ncbi:MAG: hypothetical protein RLZZ387_1034 [Chloroflexota bacterium]|jgi:homoserine kinase type II
MLTTSDIARVLSRYSLGAPAGLASTGHGFVNETAIVTTTCGRFVVRRNHRRFPLEAHRSRHTLIAALVRQGVPTAALLPARDGSTLQVIDGRAYEVQEYVEGQDYDRMCHGQTSAAGAVLARYHRAAQDLPRAQVTDEARYAPFALSGLIERLLERDIMGDLHDQLAWYDARASQLRAQLPDAAYADLPHLLIHGDVHSDNFCFAGDRVAALLDFDQVAWDARVVDLADALVAFATDPLEPHSWGVFRGPLDEERAAALVEGYTQVWPLSVAEAWALQVALEVLWLRAELGRVISTSEGAPEYHLEVLEQGRRLSGWLELHAEALVRRWLEGGRRSAVRAA